MTAPSHSQTRAEQPKEAAKGSCNPVACRCSRLYIPFLCLHNSAVPRKDGGDGSCNCRLVCIAFLSAPISLRRNKQYGRGRGGEVDDTTYLFGRMQSYANSAALYCFCYLSGKTVEDQWLVRASNLLPIVKPSKEAWISKSFSVHTIHQHLLYSPQEWDVSLQ